MSTERSADTKTLSRWKTAFSTVGIALLVLLFFHWLVIPDYSFERMLNRRVAFCVAVIFLVAALMLNVVKKVLLEETE